MAFTPSSIVDEGDLLFVIERDQYQAARDEADAALRSAKARLALAESDLERIRQARESEAVSEQDLDRAVAQRDQAEAGVMSAEAKLVTAELNYDYTLVMDAVGIKSRHDIGVDTILWSNDFPHATCDWPNDWDTIERHFAGVPADEKHKMLAGNAEKLYRLGNSA